ncbi:MAG: tRNA guanosine(34) transglycosylase Tgt [Lewinellaceae bacterium]|nr:tRNA guanosine(34) transglycosylase Tgt [Saprospiraceae bacterium]MCB9313566.1 tRNA guanosine(34) transglycosylase Tgt [Lewinellaceae bacterium]
MFTLQSTDPGSSARAGLIQTDHGEIQTPIFMPVGTVGTVKAIAQDQLRDIVRAQIILGNTYHLYLRPGLDVLEAAGGLHHFIGWDRPMLTDSGGYQVYSLARSRKINENGVVFQSHIDGSRHLFTPESAMDIQRVIGADIIMAFDECPPYPSDYRYAKDSMELTHRWWTRCKTHMEKTEPRYGHRQFLFPIIQGSTYHDLRLASAEFMAAQDAPGIAIGGLSVGEPAEEMYRMTELVTPVLPTDRPRYLMGVGTPENILTCIGLGIDMFDCVMPTRNARHGLLFTRNGIINIKNKKWADDFSPVDPDGPCPASRETTKAYLRHLIHSGEILGGMLATQHNLSFYLWLVGEARRHILEGTFTPWKDDLLPRLTQRL